MIDHASNDQAANSPDGDDDQVAAANAFARAEGGALVEPPADQSAPPAGAKAPQPPPPVPGVEGDLGAGVGTRATEPAALDALYVRLPSVGWGAHRFYAEIGARLRDKNIFRVGREVVVVDDETGAHQPMTANWFTSYVNKFMIPAQFKWNGDTFRWDKKEATMKKDHAAGCLESDQFLQHIRRLARVNTERMPVLRADGRLDLLKPGYDAETRTYTLPGALQINEDLPLSEAIAIYNNLVKEFPFGDYKEDTDANREKGVVGKSRSMAVHLVNMVSLYAQGLLSPLNKRLHFVYVANSQRSGKTLLAQAAIVPIFGAVKTKSLPKDDAELRKMLATAAFQNKPYLFLDNLEGMLRSPALDAFMTSSTYSDRVFQAQVDMDAEKQTVVIITGNNLALSTDIANRTLRCQLYTEEADTQGRKIQHEFDEDYLARPAVRRDLLSALWALVREWNAAGRPTTRKLGGRVLKGFEPWCDRFGGIVMSAGFVDPCEAPPTDDFSGDTEGADMETLVKALVYFMDHKPNHDGGFGVREHEFDFADLVEAAMEEDCFTWMIQGTKRLVKSGAGEEKYVMELTPGAKSSLGKMFSAKYGGRRFRLPDGRTVRFGLRGRNRHRKYQVEIMEARGA